MILLYLRTTLLIMLGTILLINPTFASPEAELSDPRQEKQARELFKMVKCLVCSGQSIEDSGAEAAKSMRLLIREKIQMGKSKEEIFQFLTKNYGDSVLFVPPVNRYTILLWFGPFLVFGLGIVLIIYRCRGNRNNH
jgi:cytochrome c-type biogenesis protein CcmH